MSRIAILGVACLVTDWFAVAPRAQTPQATLSASEQAAIEVVRGWVGGWEAKNPGLVGSFMDEDVREGAAAIREKRAPRFPSAR